MISLRECARLCGLRSKDLIIGVPIAPRHHKMLSDYLLNLDWGTVAVCRILVADLRGFLDLGMNHRAADLLIVLRLFLTNYRVAPRGAFRQASWSSNLSRSEASYKPLS